MLRVDDLTYSYPGAERPAASGLVFEVAEGEVFGLLGPSGAGKSTTQGILIGLLKGWQGAVDVMRRPLADWGADYYEHVGVSFEVPNHFGKLTARENLDYFRSLYASKTATAEEVLARVGLEDAIDTRVSDFSKGMKNRLTFARSLLHAPKLWFLDEPTSGLDPVNARNIQEIVRQRQAEGATVVLTTHDMHVADALCDRVGFIVDGRLETIDTPDALKREYGRRAITVSVETEAGAEDHEFSLDGLADNAAFLDALRGRVRAVHSLETTLEDVFVKVTGRHLT